MLSEEKWHHFLSGQVRTGEINVTLRYSAPVVLIRETESEETLEMTLIDW